MQMKKITKQKLGKEPKELTEAKLADHGALAAHWASRLWGQ